MTTLLTEHFGYLSDAVKLRRYGDAIARVIRPGDVALDLGCGSGVLGLACLRAGASRVHFIDETAFLDVARRTMEHAGLGAQSMFYRSRSQRTELPERVDLIVCDHVGYFGIDYGIVDMLEDAVRRFLKPGGVVIPAELTLSMGAVESEACRALVGKWRTEPVPADYHWASGIAAEMKHAVNLGAEELISDPAQLGVIALGAASQPFFTWKSTLVATRTGHLDGIAGWFNCRLTADVWMTNSPQATERLKRPQAFFPLEHPIPVNAGDEIRVTVMIRPADHVLGWIVELPGTGKRFAHSTWNGQLLEPADLVRANPARVATLSKRGRARQIVLSYCDGSRSLAAVEQSVLADHPDLFPSRAELSSFVTSVLARDTEL